MNDYHFTERVRKILAITRKEASARCHEYVSTEHMLLALVREGEGVGAAVLQNLGINLTEFRAQIEKELRPSDGGAPTGPDLPYSSRAKKVIELAIAEARGMELTYIGSEHLLLGLLREEKGIAAGVLRDARVNIDIVRAETIKLLGIDPTPLWTPVPSPGLPRNAPLGAVDSIALDVRLTDGSSIRGDFKSVEAALHFLHRARLSSARWPGP